MCLIAVCINGVGHLVWGGDGWTMFNSFTVHQTSKQRKLKNRDNVDLEMTHDVTGRAHTDTDNRSAMASRQTLSMLTEEHT